MKRNGICQERARLLEFAETAVTRHCKVITYLRQAAGNGHPEIFKFVMEQVTQSSGYVKQAFKAYAEHLEQHQCSRSPVAAAVQLPSAAAVRGMPATQ
jgi:hypothetical protein